MELENANVNPSSRNLIVTAAVSVITVTLCVDPAIVTSMVRLLFNVKLIMDIALVNSTTEELTAAFALRNSTVFPNANVSSFFDESSELIGINVRELELIDILFAFANLFTACDCHNVGSASNVCDLNSGDCKCLSNFGGRTCNECKNGYHSFPTCSCKCCIPFIRVTEPIRGNVRHIKGLNLD